MGACVSSDDDAARRYQDGGGGGGGHPRSGHKRQDSWSRQSQKDRGQQQRGMERRNSRSNIQIDPQQGASPEADTSDLTGGDVSPGFEWAARTALTVASNAADEDALEQELAEDWARGMADIMEEHSVAAYETEASQMHPTEGGSGGGVGGGAGKSAHNRRYSTSLMGFASMSAYPGGGGGGGGLFGDASPYNPRSSGRYFGRMGSHMGSYIFQQSGGGGGEGNPLGAHLLSSPAPAQHRVTAAPPPPPTVLVVEEHAATRAVLSKWIAQSGFREISCSSGAEGVAALSKALAQAQAHTGSQPSSPMFMPLRPPPLDGAHSTPSFLSNGPVSSSPPGAALAPPPSSTPPPAGSSPSPPASPLPPPPLPLCIDAILCDLSLSSGLGGNDDARTTFLDWVLHHGDPSISSLPCVVLPPHATGDLSNQSLERLLRRGVADVVPRPLNRAVTLTSLRMVLLMAPRIQGLALEKLKRKGEGYKAAYLKRCRVMAHASMGGGAERGKLGFPGRTGSNVTSSMPSSPAVANARESGSQLQIPLPVPPSVASPGQTQPPSSPAPTTPTPAPASPFVPLSPSYHAQHQQQSNGIYSSPGGGGSGGSISGSSAVMHPISVLLLETPRAAGTLSAWIESPAVRVRVAHSVGEAVDILRESHRLSRAAASVPPPLSPAISALNNRSTHLGSLAHMSSLQLGAPATAASSAPSAVVAAATTTPSSSSTSSSPSKPGMARATSLVERGAKAQTQVEGSGGGKYGGSHSGSPRVRHGAGSAGLKRSSPARPAPLLIRQSSRSHAAGGGAGTLAVRSSGSSKAGSGRNSPNHLPLPTPTGGVGARRYSLSPQVTSSSSVPPAAALGVELLIVSHELLVPPELYAELEELQRAHRLAAEAQGKAREMQEEEEEAREQAEEAEEGEEEEAAEGRYGLEESEEKRAPRPNVARTASIASSSRPATPANSLPAIPAPSAALAASQLLVELSTQAGGSGFGAAGSGVSGGAGGVGRRKLPFILLASPDDLSEVSAPLLRRTALSVLHRPLSRGVVQAKLARVLEVVEAHRAAGVMRRRAEMYKQLFNQMASAASSSTPYAPFAPASASASSATNGNATTGTAVSADTAATPEQSNASTGTSNSANAATPSTGATAAPPHAAEGRRRRGHQRSSLLSVEREQRMRDRSPVPGAEGAVADAPDDTSLPSGSFDAPAPAPAPASEDRGVPLSFSLPPTFQSISQSSSSAADPLPDRSTSATADMNGAATVTATTEAPHSAVTLSAMELTKVQQSPASTTPTASVPNPTPSTSASVPASSRKSSRVLAPSPAPSPSPSPTASSAKGATGSKSAGSHSRRASVNGAAGASANGGSSSGNEHGSGGIASPAHRDKEAHGATSNRSTSTGRVRVESSRKK